jgi:chemotaxis signal transduction protein
MHDDRQATIDDCWNRIGIQGDHSCPLLEKHVHCRHCDVYASAAKRLLDRFAPDLDRQESAAASAVAPTGDPATPVLVFRLGAEWLALPSSGLVEVATIRPVHTLPRRGGLILGVCNVRGRLLICASLGHLLGLPATTTEKPARKATARLLILGGTARGVVAPVDEVDGMEAFPASAIGPVPATITGAQFASGVVRHRDRAVGILDHARVMRAIERSLA